MTNTGTSGSRENFSNRCPGQKALAHPLLGYNGAIVIDPDRHQFRLADTQSVGKIDPALGGAIDYVTRAPLRADAKYAENLVSGAGRQTDSRGELLALVTDVRQGRRRP